MSRPKHVLLSRSCIALVLGRTEAGAAPADGPALFADVLRQNALCFWNACLARSVGSLEYRGCLVPCTLLVAGTDFALEVVRSAWARRVLRPPKGYVITKLGDVGVLEMRPLSQTQFAPLSEALCKGVADLNGEGRPATAASVRAKLEEGFPEMQLPCDDILHKTLGALIRERKLYHNGDGYFVVSPSTYSQRAVSPLCERQMLMTNEEAIVKLHGGERRECSLAVQVDETDIAAAWKCSTSSFMQANTKDVSCQMTQVPPSPDLQYLERSHSLKVLRMRNRSKTTSEGMDRGGSFKEKRLSTLANDLSENIADLNKSEKQSMLAKLLKRMQSLTDKPNKHVAFSAQFPPLEWLNTDKIHCHSVATQTIFHKVVPKPGPKRLDPGHQKIPWAEADLFEGRGMTHYFTSSGAPKPILPRPETTKNGNVLMRQGSTARNSPSHRYSHGNFTGYAKRRHRRSSSESPKVHKNKTNGCRSPSKSPTDLSDAKLSLSSSGSSANPKAIVNPRLRDPKTTGSKAPKDHLAPVNPVHNPQEPKAITDSSKLASTLDSRKEDNRTVHDAKLALSESSSVASMSCNGLDPPRPEPLVLKSLMAMPAKPPAMPAKTKEIIIDNSVSVEVALEKSPSPTNKNVSTTVVTEETTVTKGKGNSKVVTVTSITTSLSHGKIKDMDKLSPGKDSMDDVGEKPSVNDLNIETGKNSQIIDCSSSCNIVTEVK